VPSKPVSIQYALRQSKKLGKLEAVRQCLLSVGKDDEFMRFV